jgi:iron complex outermembrane receptor protein
MANIRFAYSHQLGRLKLSEFIRIDNVSGAKYVGAVIVNEGNGRFYEPSPGRNVIVGLNASYVF